jgi:hypothetical protein
MNIANIKNSKQIFLLPAVRVVSHNIFYFQKQTYKFPPCLQGKGEIHRSKEGRQCFPTTGHKNMWKLYKNYKMGGLDNMQKWPP